MFNIKDMIAKRCLFSARPKFDLWEDDLILEAIDHGSAREAAFITVGSTLRRRWKSHTVLDKYQIVGAYKLGPIFVNSSVPFYIVHLSKIPSTGLKISLFAGKCHSEKRSFGRTEGLIAPAEYSAEWNQYIAKLEQWINGGEIPASDEYCEFNFIPKEKLLPDNFVPDIYSDENLELQELIKQQETKPLSELADVIVPKLLQGPQEAVKVLKAVDLRYPFDVTKLAVSKPTDILLQKGDIVIPRMKSGTKVYLFDYNGNEHIYASQNLIVIKCHKIIPEFLYLYLNSETAIKVMDMNYIGVGIPQLSAKNLREFPVVVPTQEEQFYISQFNTLTRFQIRDYQDIQNMSAYMKHIETVENKQEKAESVEDILNVELARGIKAYREEQLRAFLDGDLNELNICFRNKAYKSTLILAGSILEAVLIDWLSEIHGKDYFKEDYYIIDRRGNEKRADLIDMIDEIKYLRRPNWASEANKAHIIRKKRNLVHAKLCMSSNEINEDVCREVIAYLEDVLKTRGVVSQRLIEGR